MIDAKPRHRRIDPISTPVRNMLMEAMSDPEARSVIEEIERAMIEDDPKRKRRLGEGATLDHRLGNGIVLKVMTASRAKATLTLAKGVQIKNDTLVAKGTVLPLDIVTGLSNVPLGDVVATGIPSIDATRIRAARQEDRTLTLLLDTLRDRISIDELLGRMPPR